MGRRIEEGEHRVEMHRVTVESVTVRSGEPGQLNGRSLNYRMIERRYFHLCVYITLCLLLNWKFTGRKLDRESHGAHTINQTTRKNPRGRVVFRAHFFNRWKPMQLADL